MNYFGVLFVLDSVKKISNEGEQIYTHASICKRICRTA